MILNRCFDPDPVEGGAGATPPAPSESDSPAVRPPSVRSSEPDVKASATAKKLRDLETRFSELQDRYAETESAQSELSKLFLEFRNAGPKKKEDINFLGGILEEATKILTGEG